MTWKDEIKKKISIKDTPYRLSDGSGRRNPDGGKESYMATKEIVKNLMEEVDKIPESVLQILTTPAQQLVKKGVYDRKQTERILERKIRSILDGTKKYDIMQDLMKNKIFASVLGDLKYDLEYTRDE